jgi:phage gp29-like protein
MQLTLPSFDNIKARLTRYIAERIPVSRRTIYKALYAEQPLSTATLDVGTVHAILDGTDFGNTNEYFALCDLIILSDSHLQGELAKRKLAILGDQRVVAPIDKKNAQDMAAVKFIEDMVDNCPSFLDAIAALLDSSIWPLSIVEKVFRPATTNRNLSYELDKLIRVPPRLFNYTQTGTLRIWDTDPETGMVLGTLSDPDPMRYIIHRGHLLTTPDYRGGPMRALVFWSLFSSFDRDWWARFLDRYGSPFMVGKYDQADDDSRIILQNAFSLASKLCGIVISRQTDVELKEAMTRGGSEGFELFFKTCNREKSKLIVGQTTSADAEHGGMGSTGVATAQAHVRGDIRQFDSVWLGNTLKNQLFDPFLKINGIPGRVKITWGAEESADIEQTSMAVANLAKAGIEVTDEGLDTLGIRVGLPLQRKKIDASQPPGGPGGGRIKPFSVLRPPDRYELAELANESVAREGAAPLARAFRGAFAPVAKFIADSADAEELVAKITTHYADFSPAQLAPLILEALSAQAANGAARDVA